MSGASWNRYVIGDALSVLRTLPDESFNCCVTSPPYWGLRDYGVDGQIGLEEYLESYIENLVVVFRELRRTLRNDGTLWLNMGDTYIGSRKGSTGKTSSLTNPKRHEEVGHPHVDRKAPGLKRKDMVGLGWRVAFALQADGWWFRSDIVWEKPSGMPESVFDRPTSSHEFIFLLSKSAKCYYDYEAVKVPAVSTKDSGNGFNRPEQLTRHGSTEEPWTIEESGGLRHLRDVWTVAPVPFKGAHFAAFPPKLIKPCVLAGCPPGGIVLDPFLGTGTTGRVAEDLGRRWFGIELNPNFAEFIDERMAQRGLFA